MRFLLIASSCLVVIGLGLYASNQAGVHEWLRSFGKKGHAPDEIVVRQRSAVDLPGFDGAVRLKVGDIKRGRRAEIEAIGAGQVVLAANPSAAVGDRITFEHAGLRYELHVLKYEDDIGSGDCATFRLDRIVNENARP